MISLDIEYAIFCICNDYNKMIEHLIIKYMRQIVFRYISHNNL
jgi:hypothetical protein